MSNIDTIPDRRWLGQHTVTETDSLVKRPWYHHLLAIYCFTRNVQHQLFVIGKGRRDLYNDLSPEAADQHCKALVPQSYNAVTALADLAAQDTTISKTYIVCEKDNAFPVRLLHELSAELRFNKLNVNGRHSAFASVVAEMLAGLLILLEQGLLKTVYFGGTVGGLEIDMTYSTWDVDQEESESSSLWFHRQCSSG